MAVVEYPSLGERGDRPCCEDEDVTYVVAMAWVRGRPMCRPLPPKTEGRKS